MGGYIKDGKIQVFAKIVVMDGFNVEHIRILPLISLINLQIGSIIGYYNDIWTNKINVLKANKVADQLSLQSATLNKKDAEAIDIELNIYDQEVQIQILENQIRLLVSLRRQYNNQVASWTQQMNAAEKR